MRILALPLLLALTAATTPAELARLKAEAARVTITRDDWGIAHVSGPTDADAVFGMIYAQAEDDFPRIEANYLTSLGRTAEADGEQAIWQDLRYRLYYSPAKLQRDYTASPAWLKALMNSWADGLNYYLATHPQVHPRALTHFEPWMALSFTEGSIGGDIERIDLDALKDFYSGRRAAQAAEPPVERQGSNGIAIAPRLTAPGTGSLLLINPHTSWYFRSELQMTSGEGLDAYGAATWGQFFIYQGFNAHAGWMHTSSGVDSVDEFAETIVRRGGKLGYRIGNQWKPLAAAPVTIRYRKADGTLGARTFTTYRTQHGPIVRSDGRHWIAFAMMDKPVPALEQSFGRTKANDLAAFLKVAELKANSSNNTIFADDKGEIAYLHPQFVPLRDDRFDYTRSVDGSNPATAWKGLTPLDRLPSVLNPPNGWVQNTNTWPYRAAGAATPDGSRFPRYMDMYGENYRGLHAQKLLEGSSGWTLDRLNAAAFDSFQPGFAALVPQLVAAYDALAPGDPLRARLAGPVAALRGWDYRWGAQSVPESLAMAWGIELTRLVERGTDEPTNHFFMRLGSDSTAATKLDALDRAVRRLQADFGAWQVPWGEINRSQRISAAIANPDYSDSRPSIPIPFAEGNFGSLASVRSLQRPGTKRWYGDYGNSFVAVVQFSPDGVKARAITAGGESGDPGSPHFNDEAERFASGDLRTVYFYPAQLKGHTERTYRPGE